MAQQDIDSQHRSAIRTGGIALICLGALLAGVVVTMNSGDAPPRRELRASTMPNKQYVELGLSDTLAFANEQLLAATSNKRHLSTTVSPSASPSTSPSMTPSASPSTSPSMSPSSSPSSSPSMSPSVSPSASPTTPTPSTSPTTPTPTASPTSSPSTSPTSSPTKAPTFAAVSYSAAATTSHQTTFTLNVNPSDLPAGFTTNTANQACDDVNQHRDACTCTTAAGSTVVTLTIYAVGASISTITSVAAANFGSNALVATFLQNAVGVTYTVTGFSAETIEGSSGDDDSSGLSTGALVGIIVGSVVGVALIGVVIFLLVKKAGSPKGSTAPEY